MPGGRDQILFIVGEHKSFPFPSLQIYPSNAQLACQTPFKSATTDKIESAIQL
jgi:hypothetical protein